MYIIYLLTNLTTGKKYVGKSSKSLEKRWRQHVQDCRKGRAVHLYNAMRKYGEDSFSRIVIDTASNNERACEFESYYIRLYDTHLKEKGYNLTMGGDGGNFNEETRQKIGLKSQAAWQDPEIRKNRMATLLRGPASPKYGVRPPESAIQKARERMTGCFGELNSFYGQKHTLETRQVMSAVKKQTYLGDGNPQFNSAITNEDIVRLYGGGKSIKEIASMLGAPKQLIYRRARRLSLGPYVPATRKRAVA